MCERAHRHGVRVFVDAEESWFQGAIDALADEMMARYNRESAIVWNTYQLYRHDRLETLQHAHDTAAAQGYFVGAKLVRGAYMEKEGRVATQRGHANPINPTKAATDQLYDEALRYCVEHLDRISVCAGTHNEDSSRLLAGLLAEQRHSPRRPAGVVCSALRHERQPHLQPGPRRLQHRQVRALRPR